MPTRAATIERLSSERFDLLVIGGGIVGAAVAAHAARAGVSTALVDAGDFGGGTSSASSKLVHGGLRYLRLGDVRLVREAHHERRILTSVVAPHLVQRLPFLLPLYEKGPYRPAVVQSGIVVYSILARSRLNWLVDPDRARSLVPPLRSEGLRSCALYADATTNDARLCLENVRAAADADAAVLNGAEVVGLRTSHRCIAGAHIRVDGEEIEVDARVVVNAAGPWVDHVRRLETPHAGTSVRLSRGAHVLVPAETNGWAAALTIPQNDVRVTFAVPWYGMLLLGTTDTPFEGDPGAVAVEDGDIDTICREAAVALDPALVAPERVRSAFAGLRVLPAGEGETTSARRETVFTRSPGGMLNVAGGKLTTYRRIALEALDRLRTDLGLHRLDKRPWPLPGARRLDHTRLPQDLDPDIRAHLLHLYGGLATDVLEPATEDESLLRRLHPDGPDIEAQVRYAASIEWARTPDDVVRRRTTLFLRGLADETTTAHVEELLNGVPAQPAR